MTISEIQNEDLKKKSFVNAQFIHFAEGGAMGEPGAVNIVTSGGSIFHCNYVFGDVRLSKLRKTLPALEILFTKDAVADEGWELQDMGAGNYLLIRNDAYEDFKTRMGNAEKPSRVYAKWMDVVWTIIEERNKGRLGMEVKPQAEIDLVLHALVNSAGYQDIKKMTEEERIEEDIRDGYDPFEDERVIITPQLVHGDEIPDCLNMREGFFTGYRSYMSEMWCWEQITSVTYYFPAEDPLEGEIPYDEKFIENYLISKGKIIEGEEHPMKIMILDCDGITVYSVTVSVACDDEYYCEAYM